MKYAIALLLSLFVAGCYVTEEHFNWCLDKCQRFGGVKTVPADTYICYCKDGVRVEKVRD